MWEAPKSIYPMAFRVCKRRQSIVLTLQSIFTTSLVIHRPEGTKRELHRHFAFLTVSVLGVVGWCGTSSTGLSNMCPVLVRGFLSDLYTL